jgi:hypothetical protein
MISITEFVLSGLLGIVTGIALMCYAEWQTLKEKADG